MRGKIAPKGHDFFPQLDNLPIRNASGIFNKDIFQILYLVAQLAKGRLHPEKQTRDHQNQNLARAFGRVMFQQAVIGIGYGFQWTPLYRYQAIFTQP